MYLALRLEKPILITGAPGVGKTEIAKVLSGMFGTDLIRLQCYEGLDESKALYEWNYQRQLIKIQLIRDGVSGETIGTRSLLSGIPVGAPALEGDPGAEKSSPADRRDR